MSSFRGAGQLGSGFRMLRVVGGTGRSMSVCELSTRVGNLREEVSFGVKPCSFVHHSQMRPHTLDYLHLSVQQ